MDIQSRGHIPVAQVREIGPGLTDLGVIELIAEYEVPEGAPTLTGRAYLSDQRNDAGDNNVN